MKIFVDKEIKSLFVIAAAVLLIFMILGQIFVKYMADDYKQNMLEHDYGVAGYLYHNGLDDFQITRAFTGEKANADIEVGQKLLQTAGYGTGTQSSLIPEVESFYQKYAAFFLGLSVVFSIAILAALLLFAVRQDKRLEKANADISSFMDGNVHIRLDDHGEGSLSRLFTSVNRMATSLTSHIVKEKQSKEFLKDTISDISHQLKTPLAALQMYNEIIQDEKTENDVVDNFTLKSERELKRIENLIQNLLKLARLDTGSIELEKCLHSVKTFLEESVGRFCPRADLEGKLITLDCDDGITLSFDEEWLSEAVGNIIKNALDYTNPGSRIDILCDETPAVTEITIKDNGMGIHPEDMHYIFKRFYRSRFSKDKQGVGIGLTLSKAIVEKHGGSIVVESELGKGATFHLSFPKLSNM